MKYRFDENDDLVLEDIPEDLMEIAASIASARGVTEEDVWREFIVQYASGSSAL